MARILNDDPYHKVATDESLMEKRQHGDEEYPFRYYYEDFWDFDLHCVDWHWHPEVEFIVVREGIVRALAGNEEIALPAGAGIFINSRVLHRLEAMDHDIVPNIVFAPWLLAPEGSGIFREYIRPVLSHSVPCQVLSRDVSWQASLLDHLEDVFHLQDEEQPDHMLTVARLLEVWDLLYHNLPRQEAGAAEQQQDQTSYRLQLMMEYIHRHYREPVTLADIAASVYVSRSTALAIFQEGIHISPVAYLNQYRLRQSARLLRTTAKRVNEIAEETGFNSAGYYCRSFRKMYGMTPEEYRE